MEPLLRKLPQPRRNLLFVPIALAAALLSFLVVGFATDAVAFALLLAPFAGVGAGWALVGFPQLARADGKPLVEPRVKPWLFFVLLPLYAAFLYPFAGLALAPLLPPLLVVYVPLALALAGGAAGAYFSVGFPALGRDAAEAWGRIPPKTKPWLSIPGGLLFSLVLYFLFGWLLTAFAEASWAPLAALPAGLLLGFTLAILLFGYPRPETPLRDRVPRPTGNARPALLVATFFLLGIPFAFLVGLGLTVFPVLPHAYQLPTSLLVGYLLAFGAASAAWGLPGRWKTLPDYTPGVAPEIRVALLLPIALGVTLVGALALGFVGLDLLPALLLAAPAGLALALYATGVGAALRRIDSDGIPEKVKPLLLFAVWAVVALLLFVPATWIFPTIFAVNLGLSILVGFAVSFAFVERGLLAEWRAKRDARRALGREIRALRATKLGDPTPEPASVASAPAPEARPKRSLLGRLRRKGP